MEIIYNGIRPEDTVWQGTCPHCRSVMRCKQHELKGGIEHDQRESGQLSRETCPVCQRGFIMYKSK